MPHCAFTLLRTHRSAEWSTDDVVQKYLRPVNMEYLAKSFVENKINGAVLLGLEERYAPSHHVPAPPPPPPP